MTLKFKLGRDFCTMHLPTKFHHPMFNHSEFIVLRNKNIHRQTDFVKDIHLALLCYAGGVIIMSSTHKDIHCTVFSQYQLTHTVLNKGPINELFTALHTTALLQPMALRTQLAPVAVSCFYLVKSHVHLGTYQYTCSTMHLHAVHLLTSQQRLLSDTDI